VPAAGATGSRCFLQCLTTSLISDRPPQAEANPRVQEAAFVVHRHTARTGNGAPRPPVLRRHRDGSYRSAFGGQLVRAADAEVIRSARRSGQISFRVTPQSPAPSLVVPRPEHPRRHSQISLFSRSSGLGTWTRTCV
jgi:hypothetical protein